MNALGLSSALGFAIAAIVIAACQSGDGDQAPPPPPVATSPAACVPSAYPAGPYGVGAGEILADATFDARVEDGSSAPVSFHDAFAPCGTAKVLVLRVQAGFCGTCRWHAANLATIGNAETRARVRTIDVVVRDDDGDLPAASDMATWQSREDVPTAVVLDPTMRFVVKGASLPRVLVVDPRTMTIRAAMNDPDPDALGDAIATAVAALDGKPAPAPTPLTKIRGRWNREQWGLIRQMFLGSGGPPPDPTNRVGDDDHAAALGGFLFSDPTLSPGGEVSCERCHEKSRAFTDGSETATGGVGGATRNTPTVVIAAWSRWQLWDGRADTLWMQALLPMEDAKEFGATRLFIAHRVYDAYKDRYEAMFGPMPPLSDTVRFPPAGKPGDPAYDAMAEADRDAVTKVFVDIGKSIAAFERAIRSNGVPLELYAAGIAGALEEPQIDGLAAFLGAGCAQCHWGGRLTDDAFHPMRFPTGRKDLVADEGRTDGIPKHDANEFRSDSKWSDAPISRVKASNPMMRGAFKTPSLRGVAITGPYGHGGSVPSLEMAIDLHRTGGMPASSTLAVGAVEPWLVSFDPTATEALVAFLQTFSLGFTTP